MCAPKKSRGRLRFNSNAMPALLPTEVAPVFFIDIGSVVAGFFFGSWPLFNPRHGNPPRGGGVLMRPLARTQLEEEADDLDAGPKNLEGQGRLQKEFYLTGKAELAKQIGLAQSRRRFWEFSSARGAQV